MLAVLIFAPIRCIADKQNVDTDADQPLTIESSIVEFDDQKGTAIYTKNVIADQGSRHLTADKLIIYRDKDNKIDLIIATGAPAKFQSQSDQNKPIGFGEAETIKYFPKEDKMVLIDQAELEQNHDIIKGKVLTYFFQTGILQSEPSVEQRVTVTLQPKDKNT